MRSVIIYYSQTGSTRKIAHAIHRGMGQITDPCDIMTIREADHLDLKKYDLIGLGSPVWMGGLPPNMRIFVENIPQQAGKHVFSFNTHGVMPELYFPSVVRKLRVKGFTVIGMRDWYGSVHFQVAPKPYFTDGHPDETDLREAELFGAEMVERSRKIYSGQTDLIPELTDLPMSPPSNLPKPQPELLKDKCLYPEDIAELVIWLLTRRPNVKIGRPVLIQTMENPWQ